MTNTPSRLDTAAIIQHFGGRTPLWRLLKKHGVTLSIKTIEAWSSRDSLPAARLVQLIEIGAAIGKPLVVEGFIRAAGESN